MCIRDRANHLQANPSKTEVKWCSSGRRQHQIPITSVRISTVDVLPVSSVPSGQTSVCPQRRRTTCLLSVAFWTYHAAPARSPLVAHPRADTVLPLCSSVPLSQRHSSVYLAESICRVADVKGRRHLRSSATATLIVPPVRRSTLGDQSFSVAALRAWNSLPSAVRAASSLTTFRLELKTFLFLLEFSGPLIANSVSSYVISRYLIDCVKCPCSVLRDSVT